MLTVYMHDAKHQLDAIPSILNRCNQALQTLERYKARLSEVSSSLTALEIEDLVTVRDVVTLLQRTEVVVRIAEEVERYLVELGTDGRLVRLQLNELMAGVEDDRRQVVLDYFQPDASWNLEQAMATLSDLETDRLLDPGVGRRRAPPVGRHQRPRRRAPAPRLPHARPGPPSARPSCSTASSTTSTRSTS